MTRSMTNDKLCNVDLPASRAKGVNSRFFDMLNRELFMRLSFFIVFDPRLFGVGLPFAIGTGGGPFAGSASPFR